MAYSRSTAGQPREAIGSLCQLLNLKGITGVTPEIFRQAKFNKPEAVAPLWSLLHFLTHYSTHKCIPSETGAICPTTPSSTKHAMWAEGYRCYKLYCLPDDMSHGSREVLLACTWLLAKTDILINVLVDDKVQMADTVLLHIEEVRQGKREKVCQGSETIFNKRRLSDCAKRLAWRVGRCRMVMRQLHLQQQELCNLTHQIHIATQGLSVSMDMSHLSPLETFIIRHADQLKKHQEFLEAEQSRLNICIKWQEQQSTFWQWMESVLDAKLQDTLDEGGDIDDDISLPNASSLRSDNLTELFVELEGCTQELEHLVEDDDLDYNAENTSKRLVIAAGIKAKLVPSSMVSVQSHLHQTTRYHLASKQSTIPSAAQIPHGRPDKRVHIQEEILRLSGVVDRLHQELEDLRGGHRCRIDHLTSVLPDAVCIPPTGSTR